MHPYLPTCRAWPEFRDPWGPLDEKSKSLPERQIPKEHLPGTGYTKEMECCCFSNLSKVTFPVTSRKCSLQEVRKYKNLHTHLSTYKENDNHP